MIETQNHYYTGSVAAAQPGAPPGAPVPSVPRYLPDARSLLVGLHYSLAPLPPQPMAAAPRRPARGPVHHRRARLQRRPGALAASALWSTAGGWRRRTRRPRCPNRSSRSPSGSTATCRWPTARRCARRSWSGTRPSRRSASATPSSCSSRPTTPTSTRWTSAIASVRWMMNADAELRRHRPAATSTRAPARSSTPTSPSRACSAQVRRARTCCWCRRRLARRRPRRSLAGCWPSGRRSATPHDPAQCLFGDAGRRAAGLCAGRARGARRDRTRQPADRSSSCSTT